MNYFNKRNILRIFRIFDPDLLKPLIKNEEINIFCYDPTAGCM